MDAVPTVKEGFINMPRKKNRVTENTAAPQPKTLEERLTSAKALVARLEQQINSEKIKNDIAVDDEVSFLFGRGDSRRTLTGRIAGFKDTDQGKIVAILTTDADGLPETKRVYIRDVVENRTADARRAPVAAEGDPLDAA